MSSARASRVLRGLVAAAFSTFVALFSHVVGGGAVPGPIGVALPLVLSVLVCVALSGRRLTLLRLTLSVGISQFLFHSLFVLGAGGHVSASGGGHAAHGGSVELSVHPAQHGAAHAGTSMWLAHIGAAALTIAVLRHGDAILTRLAELAGVVVLLIARFVVAVVPVIARPIRRAVDARILAPVDRAFAAGTVSRRGPPLLVAS